MPDSYGKRQRDAVKARKAAEREERRLARRRRRDGLEVAPWEVESETPAEAEEGDGDVEGGVADPPDEHPETKKDPQ